MAAAVAAVQNVLVMKIPVGHMNTTAVQCNLLGTHRTSLQMQHSMVSVVVELSLALDHTYLAFPHMDLLAISGIAGPGGGTAAKPVSQS